MTQKTIFERQVLNGKYQAVEEVQKGIKKVTMNLLKNGKIKIIWEIELSDSRIKIVVPFLSLRWFTFSAEKSKTFIEIPKQLNEIEKLDYPKFVRRFLTDANSNTTQAWLNLDGRRRNIGYFGNVGPGQEYGRVKHKQLLKVLSDELNLQIKSN